MERVSDYSAIIEGELRKLELPTGKLSLLYEPISYALAAGGKRLRPVMVLMAAEAFGGAEVRERAMRPALGYEMFHNFTLLHDDVMDNSDTRRGRPSVHAKWDANTAILSGDTMLTLATQMVSEVEDSILRQVLDTFNSMAIEVYEGQRLDMDFEKLQEVTMPEYSEMIAKKTGALMGAALKTGALIGGATEKDAQALYDFGLTLGLAFQMEDDWLDTFGDQLTFGKPIGGDIRNNKKTFLMVKALERQDEDSKALRAALALDSSDLKVKTVTRILQRMGINDAVRKDISSTTSKALHSLKKTSMGEEGKEAFRKLVEKLASRKS